jgi:tRNA uridine 5-carbamoylmethylation protein Kti12
MPCLIITGHPSSGKTTVAKLLRERALLHDAIDEVVLLNEESECGCSDNSRTGDRVDNRNVPADKGDGTEKKATHESPSTTSAVASLSTKQQCYGSSTSEKQTRSALKSAFDRAVGGSSTSSGLASSSTDINRRRRRLVILDSLNYIKGFRYELHCISKAAGEQHGVLWILNKISVVHEWNASKAFSGGGYSPDLLSELISRYEPPDERNRWDRPLFVVDMDPSSSENVSGRTQLTHDDDNDNDRLVFDSTPAKTEVLEKSVYNMHSLADTLVSSEGRGIAQSDTSAKNSFSLAPPIAKSTKSAFQRKSNPSTTRSSIKGGQSTLNTANLASLDVSSNSGEFSSAPMGLRGFSNPTSASVGTTTSASVESTTPIATTLESTVSNKQTHVPKTLEEQLDAILDTFLLQTQALKEGISTRQNIAGQANVLQNLDSISAKVISSIATAQHSQTGGCILQVPILTQSTDNNPNNGPSQTLSSLSMKCPRPVGLVELRRLRRMYLQWAAIHPPEDASEAGIAISFVRYLEDKL